MRKRTRSSLRAAIVTLVAGFLLPASAQAQSAGDPDPDGAPRRPTPTPTRTPAAARQPRSVEPGSTRGRGLRRVGRPPARAGRRAGRGRGLHPRRAAHGAQRHGQRPDGAGALRHRSGELRLSTAARGILAPHGSSGVIPAAAAGTARRPRRCPRAGARGSRRGRCASRTRRSAAGRIRPRHADAHEQLEAALALVELFALRVEHGDV